MPPDPSRETTLVAAVDDRAGTEASHHFPSARSVWITALAIGAATVPPNPPWVCSIVTATATLGSSAGREPDEPRLGEAGAGRADRGGAGLAGDRDAAELGGGSGALFDHTAHHLRQRLRRGRFHHLVIDAGVDGLDGAPVRVEHLVDEMRLHQRAVVGHRGGHHRHLERRHQQAALADPDPADVLVRAARDVGAPVRSDREARPDLARAGSRAAAWRRSRSASCTRSSSCARRARPPAPTPC